jgi:heme-degrading monooxygenase HmoA
MYASIRIYKTDSVDDVARMVNEDFVPLIKRMPGFLGYYCVATDDGRWATVSIFETDPQTEESNRLAAEFVQHSEMISLLRRVEMITGEVVAHCSDKLATG